MNSFPKQKQTHRPKGGMVGGGIVREFRTDMYTLLYLKWLANKDLLYSTGNTAQYIFKKYFFGCATWDLSSLTRDRTHAPCSGSVES